MERQIALPLPHEPSLTRADFLPAPANALALAGLGRDSEWPQGRALLVGPEGAGKSHLVAIWAHEAGAAIIPAQALGGGADATTQGIDSLLHMGGALAIEDADGVAGHAALEAGLFHAINLATQRSARLLLSARNVPRDWGVVLPDLESRLATFAPLRLGAPDEDLMGAVLVKLFADRQMTVAPGLISWAVRRLPRDLGVARRLVAELDRRSLARKGPVTRRDAAELLDILAPHDA